MLNCVFLFEKHPEEKATAKPQPQEELKTEDCREKHIRKVREWQKQNPKSLSSYQAKYVANNKEKIAKRAKESYQKNKTQLKAKALARYTRKKRINHTKKITKQIRTKKTLDKHLQSNYLNWITYISKLYPKYRSKVPDNIIECYCYMVRRGAHEQI